MADFECYVRRPEPIQSETLKATPFNLSGVISNLLEASPLDSKNAAFAFNIARTNALEENSSRDVSVSPADHITLSRTLTLLKSDAYSSLNTSAVDSTVFAAAAINNPDYSGLDLASEDEKIWLLLLAARLDQDKYSKITKSGVYAERDEFYDTSVTVQNDTSELKRKYQEYGILISNLKMELINRRGEVNSM